MADTKADTASSTAIEVGSSFRYYYNTLADCESMPTQCPTAEHENDLRRRTCPHLLVKIGPQKNSKLSVNPWGLRRRTRPHQLVKIGLGNVQVHHPKQRCPKRQIHWRFGV